MLDGTHKSVKVGLLTNDTEQRVAVEPPPLIYYLLSDGGGLVNAIVRLIL
ncbi:MAG: hypothetical protein IPJ07_17820 [Acidobacteria bacterium]|nr:hypothetical protein [Acidobacteriota bacterium]